jgi:lipoprotein-releasing system permease protein
VYKLLLCWRYLLTRYLALACIISVMLGVATLIVVNSVMSGFSTKLRERLHGLLSDVIVEATSYDGFPDADRKMRDILASPLGEHVDAMTSAVDIFAMLQYDYWDGQQKETVTRPVRLIGIDPATYARVGGFREYLKDQKDSPNPSFDLSPEAVWRYRLMHPPIVAPPPQYNPDPKAPPPPDPPDSSPDVPHGIIIGQAIASFREKPTHPGEEGRDIYLLRPGDSVRIFTVSAQKMLPVVAHFAVCDYFKSEMSEYDSNYVFVPLDYLQHLRTMEKRVTSIQIKLKDYHAAPLVVKQLQEMFPSSRYNVQTWEHKQGALLAAISVEKGILNVLLFMIVGVAGFGILAIFAMIVVEKTRDIGILKALGASNGGVMSIFLGYGLLLGVVGASLGTALGLTITEHLNVIEKWLTHVTGQEIFPRDIYYFKEIPTDVQTWSVVWVNVGAVAIAVVFSILPALRAALLHPVRALRYE